jgi:hypothetical protein
MKPEPRPSICTQSRPIDVITEIWSTEPGGARVDCKYYRVKGAKRGASAGC